MGGGGQQQQDSAFQQLAPIQPTSMTPMPTVTPAARGYTVPMESSTMGATKPRGAYLPIEEPEDEYFNRLMEALYQRMRARGANDLGEIGYADTGGGGIGF